MDQIKASDYQFARNPFMNRWWIRNLLFGLVIAMPVSVFGLSAGWWQPGQLWHIMGLVVLSCMVLLPLYAAVIREVPPTR